MNKAEALALADAVQKAIPFKLLPREDRPERYIVELPAGPAAGPAVLARAEPNPEEPNSAVQALYQFPGRNLKDRACIELIGTILEQPFFDELRTKQQLGYIVSAGLKRVQGITSLSFLVQSNIADPLSVSEKILKFIDQSENILGKLSDQKFSEYRGGLIQKKLEPDKRLIAATVRNWEEIATEEYLYDRQQKEAEILARLSKEEVLGFFKKYLKSNSPERRLLISQVYGAKDAAILEKVQQQQQQGEIKPGKVVIGDLSSFKESRPVYPTRTEERQRNEKAS
uniref:Coenzyme PQQ synthesis protein F-like C-terminal lobe domain-containing protein n=1 Tax=Heterosigma akashiwo TaxID=2829 RepID=A0A7S4D9C8_HETAK